MTLSEYHAQTVDRSLRCRPFRRTARKIASCCLLTPAYLWTGTRPNKVLRHHVVAKCRENQVGNPLIIIAILGIIINLVWQWWLHRRTAMPMMASEDWGQLAQAAQYDLEN
jgi:hypothetical protein